MASMSDPHVQETLMKDPLVQDAMRRAGQSALADPEVQRQVLAACKEKFPELAAKAQDQISLWARDPELQRQAQQYAGVAADYAKQSAARAGEEVLQLIEQGPAGIRLLAFGGGCASCVNASSILLGLLNPLTVLTNAVQYMISMYQLIFALTTMLFEAPPEYIAMVPGVSDYQDLLIQKARFLSETAGRGMFYLFQGSLWLVFASLTDFVSLSLGFVLVLIAGFHISMHYGVMPQEIAQKMRAGAVSGYLPLPMSADADMDVAPADAASVPTVGWDGGGTRITAASVPTVLEAERPTESREGPAVGWAYEAGAAPSTVKEPTPAPEVKPQVALTPEPETLASAGSVKALPLRSRTPTPEPFPSPVAPTPTMDPAFAAHEPPSPRPGAVSKPKCCVVS